MQLKENIKWIYSISKGMRARIALYTLLGLCSVAASLLFVWLTKSLIDMATKGAENSLIHNYIALLVGTILFQQLLTVLRGKLSNRTSTQLMNRLRLELFDTVMRSEWQGKELRHTGDVVNRIENDSRTISEALCITIPSIFVTVLQFLASFRFLHTLDARLSWVIVVIMPFSLVLSKRYLFTMRKLTQAIRATDSSVQSHIQEQIQNRTIINTVGNTSTSVQTLHEWNTTLLAQTMRRVNYTLFSRTTVQLGFGAGYIVALVWGIYGLKSGAVTFGMLTAFLQLVSQIQRPSVELATQISTTAQCTASAERLQEIYELRSEENEGRKIVEGAVGISARQLDFEYADGGGRKVLSNFSYDFAPNSLHVIIGHTGVGKSTLIRLMLGLLKPNSGELALYNKLGDRELCSVSTRPNFVYVPQGNTLMSGTIRQNLLLANDSASQQELLDALHTAVADFVLDLPQGLDTLCGERGTGLSEGEAQRVAIARGLLQRGGVMLLDEPTSALDSQTEQLLISRLAKYAQNRTLIMVTHRDTAAQLCASVVKMS
ncbi:MAG: ABC transporter ATP-binding protein [Rikenellaceae bacterium]